MLMRHLDELLIEQYFTNTFPQFSVSQECEVSFGSKQAVFADVVLYTDKPGYFVAIAECKKWPLPISHDRAKAQLKSYMSATNTRYGVLAVGTDPGNWEFCENKPNNWFAEVNRGNFEWSIENWEPVSTAALAIDGQAKHRTSHWWKRIALFLGILFIFSISSDKDYAEGLRKNPDLVE